MKQKGAISVLIIFIVIISFACNIPMPGTKIPVSELSTAQSIVSSAQPSLAVLPQKLMTEAVPGIDSAATLAANGIQNLPQNPLTTSQDVSPTPNITPISHQKTPASPGKAVQMILDFNSQTLAGQHRTNADYYDTNLLERPFDSEMNYRGDVDIIKAEISNDGYFYYFTIYLQNLKDPKDPNAMYGVELDTNFDGRGDYLVWVGGQQPKKWSTDTVFLYSDPDADVGGKTPLQSDAPSSGNGYEKILTSSQKMSDPDAVWYRINPADPNSIQIALKRESINKPTSFMWSAWADDGVKSPDKFDYNDFFTIQDAGSPIKDDNNYPLKDLNTVDNTCRGIFGRVATGIEPGLCGDNVTKPVKTMVNITIVPPDISKITPGPIKLP